MPTREQVLKYQATRNAKRRERYASDPEYRALRLRQAGEHQPTAEQVARYRETRNAKRRARYASDPEYRAQRLAESRTTNAQIRRQTKADRKWQMELWERNKPDGDFI